MGHHGTQFRAKADLPVGFPYRFNSSFLVSFCIICSRYDISCQTFPIKIFFQSEFRGSGSKLSITLDLTISLVLLMNQGATENLTGLFLCENEPVLPKKFYLYIMLIIIIIIFFTF